MSIRLLRQNTSHRIICSASHTFCLRRFYARTLQVAHAPMDYGHATENHDTAAAPIATKKSRAKKGRGPSKKSKATKLESLAPRKDPLAATGLDLYLKEIRDSSPDPTLSDIEQCRPNGHTENMNSPQYADEYNALVDKLCRSFSRQQLREFNVMLKLNLRATATKHQFAESIIEKQWRWPSLKEVQKRHRDRTEISVKTFPVNPTQLFLILGKDGAELLQMSKEYNVHIAVTPNPLSLRVEGLTASLNALSEHIAAVKNAIVEETFELPGGKPIKQDLMQPISRLADAFVENLGDSGTVRICARQKRDLELARRLLARAAFEAVESSRTTLISYLPTGVKSSISVPRTLFPYTYSVYPFLSPRSLPWTMKSGGAFRIRRVFEWLGEDAHENTRITGGLAEGNGRILTIDNKELTLKDTLFAELSERHDDTTASTRIVTASFGHVLLPAAISSQRASIIPPIKGFWPFEKILTWLDKSRTDTTFVPSLPIQLLNSVPKQQTFLVRFFYHAVSEFSSLSQSQRHLSRSQPTRMIRFEVVLARSRSAEGEGLDSPGELQSKPKSEDEHLADNVACIVNSNETTQEYDCGISMTDNNQALLSSTAENTDSEAETTKEAVFSTQSRCWAGIETSANLILPDRPMDIRFTAFDYIYIPRDQEPERLRSYSSALQSFLQGQNVDEDHTAPMPPNNFVHDGETYVLHKSSSVRQSTETLSGLTDDEKSSVNSLQVVSESILDLESQQKSTVCKVSCVDYASDDSWKAFLADCDRLTSELYGGEGADAKSLGLDID